MDTREIAGCLRHKMAEYRPVLPDVELHLLRTEPFLEAALAHSDVQQHLELGWYDDFEAEFRDAVLADVDRRTVTACPPMLHRLVHDEPRRIQEAYVKGAFLRRLFRFCVVGVGWEADEQVRDIMARHFSFLLVAVEAVDGHGALPPA